MYNIQTKTKLIPTDQLQIRKNILKIINQAGSSHIGSALSIVEILVAIYNNTDIEKIKKWSEDRDRVILSKGHAVAAQYSVLHEYCLLSDDDLQSYLKTGSIYSGHVTHHAKFIEHSTGALGHGLSVAVGMAYGLKIKKMTSKVYVVVGDGELHEGSNWEALMLASALKLDNLFLFVDYNNLSGIGSSNCCGIHDLESKLNAFGTSVFEVDGHDIDAIENVLALKNETDKPVAIICHTTKGKGISFMENENVWHYRPVNDEYYAKAIHELEADNGEL